MSYILDTYPKINLPESLKNEVIEELLCNYTHGKKWNIVWNEQENCITAGNYTKAELGDEEYVIYISDDGIYIGGADYQGLIHGFLSFLDKIKYSSEGYFYVENCCEARKPKLGFRCVHLCIFPETKLNFLRKYVRSCAVAKYSHIIFEFWGMLKFDCLKELSWPFAYSKEEIKNIVREANSLGVEIIPMFNHLGHASACREINGKHVVLDQNPQYEYMFESYGWVWNFKRDDVYGLLSKVREELIEVCGEGSYFHIGCDEAYAFGRSDEKASEMVEYLNKVAAELKEKGRRCIMWHDMLLSRDEFDGYVAHSDKSVSGINLKNLDKSIIIADWQYSCHNEEWKTSEKLKESGFDVVCCPWDNKQNVNEAVDTVISKNLFGIIHTTWHTLFHGFREMIYAGVISYGTDEINLDDIHRFYCAFVARKALPSFGEFEKCGWSEKMTGAGL